MHDDGAEILFAGKECLANAEQVVFDLAIERNAGPDAGMDKQVIALAVIERERLEKHKMLGWYASTPFGARRIGRDAPTAQCSISAHIQPIRRSSAVARQSAQCGTLVIAQQIDCGQSRGGWSGGQQRKHTSAVRTEVDIIAKMQQHRRPWRTLRQIIGDRRVQLAQLRQTAMDVPDRVHAAAERQSAR